ncbi:unnamed protein product [Arctia plantaginis]|uniref:Uncharacterized protein n=1 Tax=Arctia plantaginis TaxID=874455 RepID=A0A8S0ZP61_ARCPL|nr:unnamed protein product [Arctia plantaginis]
MANMKNGEKKANNQDTYKYTEVACETDDVKNNEKESSIQDTFTYKEALELTVELFVKFSRDRIIHVYRYSSTASFTLTMALLGECTGKKHRSQYLFIMNSLNLSSDVFAFGLAWLILPLDFKVNVPLLNMTFRPWRLYTIALAIPLGIGAVLLFYIYESPEFLASRGDNGKASEVLTMMYERNGGKREDYPVRHITQTGLAIASKSQTFWKTLKKQTVPIFKPPLLWRTIQLYFLLALCCVTNNAFTMWYPTIVNYFFKSFNTSDSSEQTFCQRLFGDSSSQLNNTQTLECNDEISTNTIYAGMVYGVFYWLMSIAVVKVSSRPRMLLIAVLLVSGVSELLVNVKNPVANMIFFTLLQATSLGVGCISSYFVNLYPALHRGLVTSLGMMVARLCSLTAVSLVGAAITQHCEATFYTWSAFVFGGVIVCLFLPADRITTKSSIIDSPT